MRSQTQRILLEKHFCQKEFFSKFNDINSLHVVTSNWHLDRAKEIFDFIFSEKNDPKIIFIQLMEIMFCMRRKCKIIQ